MKKKFLLPLLLAGVLSMSPVFLSAQAGDEQVLGSYEVSRGSLVPGSFSGSRPESGKSAQHQIIWDHIISLIPADYRYLIAEFEVFTSDEEAGYSTDGYASLREDEETWLFGVNYTFAVKGIIEKDLEELTTMESTIIHEFAHILSLMTAQMSHSAATEGSLRLDEGIPAKNSWLNAFYVTFWVAQYPGLNVDPGEDQDAESFFRQHGKDFVSEYAATNPIEDFAESFAVFVTSPKPEETSVRNQKLLFFYGYPELVSIRTEVRKNLWGNYR